MPRSSAKDRTQVLPFPDASDLHLRIARSFALVTDWNAALNGHFPLEDVIAILTKQVEARNIALYRLAAGKVLPIATKTNPYDSHAPELSSGALARYLADTKNEALTPGSIWRLKDARKGSGFAATPAAREWDARPEICEVSLIVLEASGDQIDFLEMIFDTPPRPSPELPVSIITQAMADAWSVRAAGLITRLIKTYGRTRGSQNAASGPSDILGEANPCALSRAEQRVCHLLSTGAKPKEIAEALGISIPTVRTHLRNLFAKTETTGQVDLIALVNETRGSAG